MQQPHNRDGSGVSGDLGPEIIKSRARCLSLTIALEIHAIIVIVHIYITPNTQLTNQPLLPVAYETNQTKAKF